MTDYLASLINKGYYITTNGEQRPLFPTSTSPQSLKLLISLCNRINAKKTLELGTGLGLGSVAITSSESMQDSKATHYTVDFSTEHDQIVAALNHIKLSKPKCQFKFLHKDTCVAMQELIQKEETFDFIFIDAKHTFESVTKEFELADKLLTNKGIIVFDDTYLSEIREAIDFILQKNSNYTSFPLEKFHLKMATKLKRIFQRLISPRGLRKFKYSLNGLNIYAIQKR